jgi:hypothetical protein
MLRLIQSKQDKTPCLVHYRVFCGNGRDTSVSLFKAGLVSDFLLKEKLPPSTLEKFICIPKML